MKRTTMRLVMVLTAAATLVASCADDGVEAVDDIAIDAEYGKPLMAVELEPGKADTYDGSAGPTTAGLSGATEVWKVTGRWYHVTNEAGMAWEADSGLTWDQKFRAWVASMEQTDASSYGKTFMLRTPWGRMLPAPRLECAEAAMFLRATFASWYNLPFFLSAYSPSQGRLHFGHFGVVKTNGAKASGFPWYRGSYKDHTDDFDGMSDEEILAAWPSDTKLATKSLTTLKDDRNSFLGDDAYTGAYLDQIFLNKRVGHFILRLLTNLGSMHLVDSNRNTFNIKPEAIQAGDTLLQRWQGQGIGHTVVVKHVEALEGGNLDVTAVYGSMPRIQPKWYGPDLAKSYFTASKSGGEGTNYDGEAYVALGGGLKRWRTPVVKSGRWWNIVPKVDRPSWISASDHTALAARPGRFEELLGALTPDQEREVFLAQIAIAREALEDKPASCSNRERREEAFEKLVALNAEHFDKHRAATDAEHRTVADYVFAALVYNQSKTCCWNSSTKAMYEIVMAYNEAHIYDAETATCNAPVVFMARDGDFEVFRTFAEEIGRGEEWVAWSADETCPQAESANDVEAEHVWTPLCEVIDDVLGLEPTGAPDPVEPVDPVDPVEGCGDLDWAGRCNGNTVEWCQSGEVDTHECGADQECQWIDSYDYYWCD